MLRASSCLSTTLRPAFAVPSLPKSFASAFSQSQCLHQEYSALGSWRARRHFASSFFVNTREIYFHRLVRASPISCLLPLMSFPLSPSKRRHLSPYHHRLTTLRRGYHTSPLPSHRGHRHDEHVPSPETERSVSEGQRVTIAGIISDIALFGLKFAAGIIGHSTALIADAFHSLSDLATDIVVLWSYKIARKPWSPDHPYGFGKYETLGAMGVSVLLFVSGIGLVWHSFEHMIHTGPPPEAIALWAAAFSMIVKEGLYQWTMRIAKQEKSDVLEANAWHHRSDAVSSLLAFIGVGGQMFGVPYADPVSAVVVAGLIVKAGAEIFWQSFKELTDNQTVEAETITQISNILKEVPDVIGYHNLRARKMGPYTLVDLHITVDPRFTVTAGHQVAERARTAILSAMHQVKEVLIHVEAAVMENGDIVPDVHANEFTIHPPHADVVRQIRAVIDRNTSIRDSDHYQIHYWGDKVNATFAIVVDNAHSISDAKGIARRLRDDLLHEIPYLGEVVIKLDLTRSKPTANQ